MTAALSCAVQLAANAAAQAARFGLSLAVGLAAGIVALLYLRPARPLERALTDLFATLVIAAVLILDVEFVLGGVPELYGIVAYALGVAALPLAARLIKRAVGEGKKKRKK